MNENHDDKGRFAEGAGQKRPATRGPMVDAQRTGDKLVRADGQAIPPHIKASMVPPGWSEVQISTDPRADVLVTARDSKGRGKTVYAESYTDETSANKFARTQEGLSERDNLKAQNQANRESKDPETRNNADATWLMQEQGTRPGSEADSKGVSRLYGKSVDESNVVHLPSKSGEDQTALKFGSDVIPIRDKGTAGEINRRVASGESLEDSSYWLKSHGATTLEGRHVVQDADGGARLQFVGKEGVWHDHKIQDSKLGKMLLQRKEEAGDKGSLFRTSYESVASYAKDLDHGRFSPKDWRTQMASSKAIEHVNATPAPKNEKEYKAKVMDVAKKVSSVLGNRPAQALESYIDPAIFAGWRAHAKFS